MLLEMRDVLQLVGDLVHPAFLYEIAFPCFFIHVFKYVFTVDTFPGFFQARRINVRTHYAYPVFPKVLVQKHVQQYCKGISFFPCCTACAPDTN